MAAKRFLILSYEGPEVYGSVDASNRSIAYEAVLKDAVPHLIGTVAKGFTVVELAYSNGEEALIVHRNGMVEHGSMAQVHLDIRKTRPDPHAPEPEAKPEPAATPQPPETHDADEPIGELAPPPPPGGKKCAYCDRPIDKRKSYCNRKCAARDRARINREKKGQK